MSQKDNLTRVVLADDHALLRAGIRLLLEQTPEIEVVGEAGDGRKALELIQAHQPDVVLMDVAMPGMTGLEAVGRITRDYPDVKVIILSGHANEEYVLQALQAGASGYMLKDAATSELRAAIHAVRRGETYLSPVVSKTAIDGYLERAGESTSILSQLTPRQREILQLLSEGHNTKEIASLLNISAKTVETHRAQLMGRLNIHDVPGLVRFAIRSGLVSAQS
jgi:DNA-binding NarL/FixJ family response regulator